MRTIFVNIYTFKKVFVASGMVGDVIVSGEGTTRVQALLALGSAINNLPFFY